MTMPLLQGETLIQQCGKSALTTYRVIGPGAVILTGEEFFSENTILIRDVVQCGIHIVPKNFTRLALAILLAVVSMGAFSAVTPGSSRWLPLVGMAGSLTAIALGISFALSGKAELVISSAGGSITDKLKGRDAVPQAQQFINAVQAMKLQKIS